MTDLEKLTKELLELPSTVLVGDENIEVRYATRNQDELWILIELWEYGIYLDPGQALSLLSWLQGQKENLAILLEELQAQQAEYEATKEQREAERLNALKTLHSEAVTAWQEGGCVGPCPTLKDIVFKEQFVRVDLEGSESTPVTFVKQFPMLERMREGRRG